MMKTVTATGEFKALSRHGNEPVLSDKTVRASGFWKMKANEEAAHVTFACFRDTVCRGIGMRTARFWGAGCSDRANGPNRTTEQKRPKAGWLAKERPGTVGKEEKL